MTADAKHGAEKLLQEADLALYRAKDRGRDRSEVFDEALRSRAIGRLGTERMLRRAIDENRMRVEYQPIIDLRTGETVAAEALVRVWDPEQAQLITAEQFVEVAEESGLLRTIDDWVLSQATGQAAAWQRSFAATSFADIAINVSARHLADRGFAQSVIDELAARGVPTRALEVEVTERVLMEASRSAMTGLSSLRDAGVKVGLDDFGTGYSSLSYLRSFPLDFVKIDRSFVAELGSKGTAHAIVASVIDLSHALGMAVVAEGVETSLQLEQLTALGCDRAQGFWFAPAGSVRAIEERVLGVASAAHRELYSA
jgi:EAL domain-containing protein (putative c-di-GMP-specific phosphodiesterase class I)